MNGNYSSYTNPNIPQGTTSVWVTGGPTNLAMEPLVDQFGNLRFGNQIIPLTTPVTPFINQTPSLPNLVTPPMSLNSPMMPTQPTGQFYVVSVQESPPSGVVSNPIGNLKTQQIQVQNEGPYNTVGTIPVTFPINDLKTQTQVQNESPYTTVGTIPVTFPINDLKTQTQVQNESPYTTVGTIPVTFPINDLKNETQVQNDSPYTTVGNMSNEFSPVNGNVVSDATRPREIIKGAHMRQRFVSNPEIQPLQSPRQRRVSAPEPNPNPFRGQPYMKQLTIDHSNGEVIRSTEQEVSPLTSGSYMKQMPIGDISGTDRQMGGKMVYTSNGSVNDGTDTSSMSSASVSPYNSMPSSPRPDPQGSSAAPPIAENKQVYDPVPPRYTKPSDKTRCLMCDKVVYAMEKRGPIKDVLFHKGCFKCAVCNMTLNLKNFYQNDNDLADLNVYCQSHKPSERFGKLDAGALSINRALQAPRLSQVNEQIRGGPEAMRGGKMDASALNIQSALNAPKPDSGVSGENIRRTSHCYNMDNESVSMVHARNVPATELQGANKMRVQVWSRDERKAEGLPPPDVIRHDTEIRGYGGEPYRHDPPPENTYRYT